MANIPVNGVAKAIVNAFGGAYSARGRAAGAGASVGVVVHKRLR